MLISVVIDHDTALATVDDWTATVTTYHTARGSPAYRLSQSDGTTTNHATRLSALIALLELTAFILTIEGTEP